jgi:hypothetical protein
MGSTELERMQNLAKIVHSMQIVNDHLQGNKKSVFFSHTFKIISF